MALYIIILPRNVLRVVGGVADPISVCFYAN